MNAPLPPGQRETEDFPRFGLTPFAVRFPTVVDTISLQIGGDVKTPVDVGPALASLPRVEQCADFHCVTTWTHRDLPWSGVRFADFYREVVVPMAGAAPKASFVVLRGQDGARTSLPLEDLLADDVLLADRLFGQPLTIEHGAPLRHLYRPLIRPTAARFKRAMQAHQQDHQAGLGHGVQVPQERS